mgnify:CR=1 FL=1
MEQLQHHGITGTVPKHVLSDNMKNFTAFPLSAPADDGFIHLLGKGICSFPNNCSMTFRINAPYHFFYVYEGTLSVTDEHHTCRLADRHAALLPISGPLTIEILKATATISICIFPVSPSCSFTHCSHHLLPIRQRVLLCLLCSIRWSIYRICRKTLLMILCPSAGSPCGLPIFLRKWQSIPAILPHTGIRSRIICGKFIIYLTHNTEKIIHWTNWKIRIPSANTGSAASFLNTMGLLLSST